MQSIIFKTDLGTEIEVRDISSPFAFDILQAAVRLIEVSESALHNGQANLTDGLSVSSYLLRDEGELRLIVAEDPRKNEDPFFNTDEAFIDPLPGPDQEQSYEPLLETFCGCSGCIETRKEFNRHRG